MTDNQGITPPHLRNQGNRTWQDVNAQDPTEPPPRLSYVQTEYICDNCGEKHFGNCPKLKVTDTWTAVGEQPTLAVASPETPPELEEILKDYSIWLTWDALDPEAPGLTTKQATQAIENYTNSKVVEAQWELTADLHKEISGHPGHFHKTFILELLEDKQNELKALEKK